MKCRNTDAPRGQHDILGRDSERPGDEDLSPPGVDDRKRVLGACGERRQGRDSRDGEIEREGEPPREGEPDPSPGEAARASANDDRGEIGG